MNFKLNGNEWASVAKGALIAAAGAGLAYLSTYVAGHDFGAATPAVVAVFSVLANYLRKTIGTPAEEKVNG